MSKLEPWRCIKPKFLSRVNDAFKAELVMNAMSPSADTVCDSSLLWIIVHMCQRKMTGNSSVLQALDKEIALNWDTDKTVSYNLRHAYDDLEPIKPRSFIDSRALFGSPDTFYSALLNDLMDGLPVCNVVYGWIKGWILVPESESGLKFSFANIFAALMQSDGMQAYLRYRLSESLRCNVQIVDPDEDEGENEEEVIPPVLANVLDDDGITRLSQLGLLELAGFGDNAPVIKIHGSVEERFEMGLDQLANQLVQQCCNQVYLVFLGKYIDECLQDAPH